MTKHEWKCDCCGKVIPFKQPELPEDRPRSEMNEDRACPVCGRDMCFDEVTEENTGREAGKE